MKGRILFVMCLLTACKPMELKQIDLIKNRVLVHVADTTIRAELLDGVVTTDLRYTYFWFANGKINSSQGAYSGKLLHGQFNSYHSDTKKLLASGLYDHGLKKGNWLAWYDSGNLKKSRHYKNGLLDGRAVLYDSAGKPADTLKYRKGLLKVKKVDTVGIYHKIRRLLKFRRK